MRKYGANMIRNFAMYVSRAARTVLTVFERRSFCEIAATQRRSCHDRLISRRFVFDAELNVWNRYCAN